MLSEGSYFHFILSFFFKNGIKSKQLYKLTTLNMNIIQTHYFCPIVLGLLRDYCCVLTTMEVNVLEAVDQSANNLFDSFGL